MQLFFPMINREHSKKNHKLIEQLSKQVAKWIFIINLFYSLFFLINLLWLSLYILKLNLLLLLSLILYY